MPTLKIAAVLIPLDKSPNLTITELMNFYALKNSDAHKSLELLLTSLNINFMNTRPLFSTDDAIEISKKDFSRLRTTENTINQITVTPYMVRCIQEAQKKLEKIIFEKDCDVRLTLQMY